MHLLPHVGLFLRLQQPPAQNLLLLLLAQGVQVAAQEVDDVEGGVLPWIASSARLDPEAVKREKIGHRLQALIATQRFLTAVGAAAARAVLQTIKYAVLLKPLVQPIRRLHLLLGVALPLKRPRPTHIPLRHIRINFKIESLPAVVGLLAVPIDQSDLRAKSK